MAFIPVSVQIGGEWRTFPDREAAEEALYPQLLDQMRPGGVVAFVTSHYTMDAKSPEVRKYLAQRAELLGAIRLPNNAFRANAGTDVVSDVLFLQKRETPIDIEPDWERPASTTASQESFPV